MSKHSQVLGGFLLLCGIITLVTIMKYPEVTHQSISQHKELVNRKFQARTKEAIQALEKMERRAKYANSTCQGHTEAFVKSQLGTIFAIRSLPLAVTSRIIVDENRKILFCIIPKVASSNWKRVFLGLLGVVPMGETADISGPHFYIQKYIKFLSSFMKLDQEHKLKTYKKIMFVRDPLERLVSAFRSKFYGGDTFKYVDGMVRFYEGHPLFPFNRTATWSLMKKGLTFKMVLQYLVDQSIVGVKPNVHYESYESLCEPCTVQYDYIGEFNNLEDNANAIFEELSIDMKFPRRAGNSTAMKTANIMDEYIKTLPKALLNNILTIYRKDYERYGYDPMRWWE